MKEFEEAIKAYLDQRAAQDPDFAAKYANPKKSIKECCQYIIGEAYAKRDDRVAVFSDDETFGMAVHYYDEEDIKIQRVGGGGDVKVSRESAVAQEAKKIELTEDEKKRAHELAIERAIEEQKKKMQERKAKAAAKKEQPEQPEQPQQMSLFEF